MNSISIIFKKLFYYKEEVIALKNQSLGYFLGFGLLLLLAIPFLIFEIIFLLITNRDLGWFQSSDSEEADLKISLDEIPDELHHLIPLAEKWGIGDDCARDDLIKTSSINEINDLQKLVEPNFQEISNWLSSQPEDNQSDAVYIFTYLIVAYEESI